MTRAEAIKQLKEGCCCPACNMAIASLEAWDKAIEDIEGMKSDRMSGDTPLVMKVEVLDIINKYLEELEQE